MIASSSPDSAPTSRPADRWEFCQLSQLEARERGFVTARHEYECDVTYLGPHGARHKVIAQLGKRQFWERSPFNEAMGRLGALGWELVSVQHGNRYGGLRPQRTRAVDRWSRVAYFKRRVVDGLPVDEPALAIE